MALASVGAAPQVSDFLSLAEHQSQTPGTFFGGKPVLHLHCPDASIQLSRADLDAQPTLAALHTTTDPLNGDRTGVEAETSPIDGVDVWVTSEHLLLFSSQKGTGVQIEYPTISLHAQQGNSIYMELCLSDLAQTADENLQYATLSIIPSSASIDLLSSDTIAGSTKQTTNGPAAETSQTNGDGLPPVEALFRAISACQELHPDPDPDDGGQESLSTMPGAAGWITSENMDEFVDEDGTFQMPEGVTVLDGAAALGEGAGRSRTAAEVEDADEGAEETKWVRTG